MVNAIFCAHGKLACAMLESVQMVYGNANVEAVEFVPDENAGDIVAKHSSAHPPSDCPAVFHHGTWM